MGLSLFYPLIIIIRIVMKNNYSDVMKKVIIEDEDDYVLEFIYRKVKKQI